MTASTAGEARRPWEGLGNNPGLPWGSARQDSHSQPSRRPQHLLYLGHRRLTWLLRREGGKLRCVEELFGGQPRGQWCHRGQAAGAELCALVQLRMLGKASLAEASSGLCKPIKKPPRFSCKPQVTISY